MKKKQITFLAILALICSLAGLALGGYLFTQMPQDQTHLIDDLYQENQELQGQIEDLNERLDQFMTVSSLDSWTLTATPWADSTGADVTLTATPTEYREGVIATLVVLLDGQQVSSVPCIWDGEAFVGTASLNAADGYSYLCQLTGPSGVQQLPLMTPDSPDAGIPVYLLSSLSSYCNLVVNDWFEQSGTTLVLTDAYAQVQLPQISVNGDLFIISQELILRHNGEISARVPIKLTPSEVMGSYDLTITDLQMPMPLLEEGNSLELYLEVTLSDGRHLQAFGISWYLENGKLSSVVG